MAYGGSQARGRIGAIAAGLHQSLSNVGSKPCLQPTPQLTARPGIEPATPWFLVGFVNHCATTRTPGKFFKRKRSDRGVPIVAQWLRNPIRNHEVAGSIAALAQWVDHPALP